MSVRHRVAKLEARMGFGLAPPAIAVFADGAAAAYIQATGERMPLAEYDAHWPGHPILKAYTDWRMVDALNADWSDAPPPRSSAGR